MKCYFDYPDTVNLSHIEAIKLVRPLERLKTLLRCVDFTFETSTDYTEPGLYFIEVTKQHWIWAEQTEVYNTSFNLLKEIPEHVIAAVKNKKLRIVIIAVTEGDNFVIDGFDGYWHLHNNMQQLGLPSKSVVIISGNVNAGKQYSAWARETCNKEDLEFIGGMEWCKVESWPLPLEPLINQAIRSATKDFNSLNRAHRQQRTEHLYFLAENDILNNNVVSGGFWFRHIPWDIRDPIFPPIYIDVEYDHFKKVLLDNYPKVVDNSVERMLEVGRWNPGQDTNHEVYQSTLLSVVTESHYDQPGGLFITEKTTRPIAMGHPFMVLGQPGVLSKLNEIGFKTDFTGLDTSYDAVEDPRKRFKMFHETLLRWTKTPREEKINMIRSWLPSIEHNFNRYQEINFRVEMFGKVLNSSTQYFL